MKKLLMLLLFIPFFAVCQVVEPNGPFAFTITPPSTGDIPDGYYVYRDCDTTPVQLGDIGSAAGTLTFQATSLETVTYCMRSYVEDVDQNKIEGTAYSTFITYQTPELQLQTPDPLPPESFSITFDCDALSAQGTRECVVTLP